MRFCTSMSYGSTDSPGPMPTPGIRRQSHALDLNDVFALESPPSLNSELQHGSPHQSRRFLRHAFPFASRGAKVD